MNLKRAVAILIAALFLTGCGCGGEAEPAAQLTVAAEPAIELQETWDAIVHPSPECIVPAGGSDAFTIPDMAGRQVRFDATAERAIVLSPAACEILYALGAEGSLIGRGACCDYPPEAFDIPEFSLRDDEDVSKIISQQADVLILDTMILPEGQVARLEQAGIPVMICGAETVDQMYACFRLLGQAFGVQEQAESVIRSIQDAFAVIQANPVSDGKTIYFEMETEQGLRTAGQGTFLNDIAEMMGLKNCFADQDGWALVTEDQVVERNPDYIVTVSPFSGEGAAPEEELVCRDAWQDMEAVMNENVISMPDNELSRIGPRLVEGARMLYDFVVESLAAMD